MKKRLFALLLAAICSINLIGCGGGEEETTTAAPETTTAPETTETPPVVTLAEVPEDIEVLPEGMMRSYLTGEIVSEEIGLRRPIMLQIDNEKAAMPQNGITRAEIVYEVPIEANEVRLSMIIQDWGDIERIGPLRSARSYHPGIAAEFDAFFFHHGRSDLALPYLDDERCDNMDGTEGSGYPATFKADDHVSYHTTFTTPELTDSRIEKLGFRNTLAEDFEYKFKFATDSDPTVLTNGQTANKVSLGYKQNKPWFEYDETDGLYYRFAYGEAHIDQDNNEQVKVKNIIVQYCAYNLEWDKNTKNIHTVDKGTGVFITEGKAVPITWEKTDYWENTHYYYEDGEEIVLNQGKTWVAIVLDNFTGPIVLE